MATTIVNKQTGTSTRIVLKFDSPPTLAELRAAINKVDAADRDMPIRKAVNAGSLDLQAPVRFVFTVEAETETVIP